MKVYTLRTMQGGGLAVDSLLMMDNEITIYE